jgi:hypothetical protein
MLQWLSRRIAHLREAISRPTISPLPDTTAPFAQPGEEVAEVLYSRHKKYRAGITRRPDGRFHVHVQSWGFDDYVSNGFWYPHGATTTITDTLGRARELAREALTATLDGLEDGREDV